ncbi:DUF6270 domain-containing protein [Promicromonospora sp. NPDC023987]|uniref:DUF6270 domain-containing protein n=1 Tax=Promicromonospora sp. NPDC023987 TaxID=3155360 RepID=UPI0033F79979
MSKTRVFIYGSCVSRDTFEHFDPEQFELVEYVARQSVLSAYTKPVELMAPPTLKSRFQQRMITGDFSSSLRSQMATHSAATDFVLVDLTDERLGAYLLPDGSIVTRSVELIESGGEQYLPQGTQHIAFGTQQHFDYWTTAMEYIGEQMRSQMSQATIVLLDIPWAEWSESGTETPGSFGMRAAEANPVFRTYTRAAAQALGAHVISMEPSEVVSSPDHPWGDAPFHYSENVYLEIVRRLTGAKGRVVWGPGSKSTSPSSTPTAATRPAKPTTPTAPSSPAEKPLVARLQYGPNLVLAGTQKGGVEWLKRNLANHPDVFVADTSGSNFFNQRTRVRDSEAAASYQAAFADGRQSSLRVDASPNYFWQGDGSALSVAPHETAENIRAIAPDDAQIAIILRNPVERALSAYWAQFATGSFDLPHSILQRPSSAGVIDIGFYERHYTHWANTLGEHRINVFLYDDLVADPQSFLTSTLHALELDDYPEFWAKAVVKAPSDSTKWVIPFKKRHPVTKRELSVLSRIYESDVRFVEQLTNRDLSSWRKLGQ